MGLQVRACPFGRGVFASRPYRAGVLLGRITGRIFVENEGQHAEDYCIELDSDRVLDPDPPYRFLNHSCDPNAEIVQRAHGDLLHLRLLTLRAIPEGAEVTIDYGWPAENAVPCRCGTSACRGWIVAHEELDQLRQSPLAVLRRLLAR